ncbi:hypothetical protein GCM10009841_03030 [Microlunatus panaciterrae]
MPVGQPAGSVPATPAPRRRQLTQTFHLVGCGLMIFGAVGLFIRADSAFAVCVAVLGLAAAALLTTRRMTSRWWLPAAGVATATSLMTWGESWAGFGFIGAVLFVIANLRKSSWARVAGVRAWLAVLVLFFIAVAAGQSFATYDGGYLGYSYPEDHPWQRTGDGAYLSGDSLDPNDLLGVSVAVMTATCCLWIVLRRRPAPVKAVLGAAALGVVGLLFDTFRLAVAQGGTTYSSSGSVSGSLSWSFDSSVGLTMAVLLAWGLALADTLVRRRRTTDATASAPAPHWRPQWQQPVPPQQWQPQPPPQWQPQPPPQWQPPPPTQWQQPPPQR